MTDINLDDLRMLSDTIDSFAASHMQQTDTDDIVWSQMAELGLLTLPFSEQNGGMGMGAAGINIMMQAIGSSGLSAPFLPFSVIAGGVLEASGKHTELLEGVMAGKTRIAAGILSAGTIDAEGKPLVYATPSDAGFVLNGQMSDILALDYADKIIISAAMLNTHETGLFLVDLKSRGISTTSYPLTNGHLAGKISFNATAIDYTSLIAHGSDYENIIAPLKSSVLLAVAAQNLGNIRYLYEQTLEYAKLRKQFGRAIGSFQSLQFRIVDMWVKLEEARSLITAAVQSEGTTAFGAMTKAAWIQTIWSGRLVSEEAIQIHGAIAMTEEFAIGNYVKTLLVNEYLFGSADYHLNDYQQDLAQ